MRRARAAGFRVLVLTVDTPVAGARLRDVHNGFTIPPTLSLRTLDRHRAPPGLVVRQADDRAAPVRGVQRDRRAPSPTSSTASSTRRSRSPTWPGSATAWDGPIVIKGIQTPDDARAVVDAGANGIVISNHGGRQLDRAPTPLEQLPSIKEAVGGRAEVYLDGGVLSGSDVIAAVALGADAVLVGRAYLYGLMAGGERGVARAGELLRKEAIRTMQLLGVPTGRRPGRDEREAARPLTPVRGARRTGPSPRSARRPSARSGSRGPRRPSAARRRATPAPAATASR